MAMDETAFADVLKRHQDGDIARLLLDSGAFDAGLQEAEAFIAAEMPECGTPGVAIELAKESLDGKSIEAETPCGCVRKCEQHS